MPSTACSDLSPAAPAPQQTTVYNLVWRVRQSQHWHSEELFNRIEAHNRYLTLIQRGIEAYLERRQPVTLSA
jgi:hypothetical protein